MVVAWVAGALAQPRTVTGVVTSSEDGSSLPQLSVALKGSTQGVVTDLDGHYRITVPGPEAVLQFVYMGMATQEITVGDRSEINVVMQPVDVAIEQAVITGYGKTARAAFTGSAPPPSDNTTRTPLSRGHIREAVWGRDSEVPSRTMDTHVSRVRSKLTLRPESGYLLAPVYSYGYRLERLRSEDDEQPAPAPAA